MYIVDINTCFGRRTEFGYDLSLTSLLRSLDEHAVALAVSTSLKGAGYNPYEGNVETMAAAWAHRQLLPALTLDPRDAPAWEAELGRCVERGERVFRFFPDEQRWSVAGLAFGRILGRLAGSGATLIFSTGGLGAGPGFAETVAALTAGRGLSVILTDVNYVNMVEVIEVLKAFPHTYAETNWLATVDAVEILAEAAGAGRLLYGSGAPLRSMQKSLNQVLETGLSPADKQAILGGNALRLLGIPPAALSGRPLLHDPEPRRFDEIIIDVHTHLGHWSSPSRGEDYDPSGMLRRMSRYGVTHSIVSSYEGMRYDIESGNRRLAEAIAGRPGLMGYVELNPHQFDLSCAEMERYYALPNFAGCELELTHTRHPTASPEVRALMGEIARRGKPVLFTPADAEDAAAERDLGRLFPDLCIIHAHGMDLHWANIIADTPNIGVEFNRSGSCPHEIVDCLRVLGPKRLYFGSDQTLLSLGASIGLYLDAGLGPAERRAILFENARRAFHLPA